MFFKILGNIGDVEVIAMGRGIRELRRLRKRYGGRRWRKAERNRQDPTAKGTICLAEFHWYQAHGVTSKEFKIKRILEKL